MAVLFVTVRGEMISVPGNDPYERLCAVGVMLYQSRHHGLSIKVLLSAQQFDTSHDVAVTLMLQLTLANAHSALKQRQMAINVYQVICDICQL